MRKVLVAARALAFGATVLLGVPGSSPIALAQGKPFDGFVRTAATMISCVDQSTVGTATFVELPSAEDIKNVIVQLSVTGLTPGKHAVQIHEIGTCVPCSAAGSHLDLGPFPQNVPVTANHPFHSGDLLNIDVDSRGRGFMNHVTNRVALSAGQLSIFDLDGASIVVHALPDTYCPDPSDPNCAGGGRVACGIIEPVQ